MNFSSVSSSSVNFLVIVAILSLIIFSVWSSLDRLYSSKISFAASTIPLAAAFIFPAFSASALYLSSASFCAFSSLSFSFFAASAFAFSALSSATTFLYASAIRIITLLDFPKNHRTTFIFFVSTADFLRKFFNNLEAVSLPFNCNSFSYTSVMDLVLVISCILSVSVTMFSYIRLLSNSISSIILTSLPSSVNNLHRIILKYLSKACMYSII